MEVVRLANRHIISEKNTMTPEAWVAPDLMFEVHIFVPSDCALYQGCRPVEQFPKTLLCTLVSLKTFSSSERPLSFEEKGA